MIRHAISSCLAVAVVLMGLTAGPARADQKDIVKALAVIAGIAIIGKVIKDRNDRKDREETVVARRAPVDPVYRPHRRPEPIHPRPLPRRVDQKLLPQNCFRSFDTYEGKVQMFGRHCLENNYAFVDRMPRACRQHIRTYRGNRVGYDARCLRDSGYRLARG